MSNHAYYLSNVLDPETLNSVTNKALRYLRKVKANAIVVTGVSGMLIGGAISVKGFLPCVVVRKNTRDCHSSYSVEVPYGVDERSKIVFVDDLISSGKTLKRVIASLKREGLTISKEILNYKPENDTITIARKKYTTIDISPSD